MPRQAVATTPPSIQDPSFRSARIAKLSPLVLATFATISTVTIFVPLNPEMPDKGITPSWIAEITEARRKSENVLPLAKIDQSWSFAINEAVARHLRFGKDVIFPFGPYASIYTQSFHPATDRLMILGSLLLSLSYVITLLYLAHGRRPYMVIILMLFLATFPSRDALLFSFPFVPVVCAMKFANSDSFMQIRNLSRPQLLAISVTFSALGMLPLIKGSLLFSAALSAGVLSIFLLYRFPYKQSIPLILIPLSATIALWILAGQAVYDLPAFLRNIVLLTSGYTDAMSSPWVAWPNIIGHGFVIIYVLASALIWVSLARAVHLKVWSRWLIGFVSTALLLVAFKHGFIRADHLSIAFNSIAIIILTIACLYTDRCLIASLMIVMVIVVGIYFRYDPVLVREIREHFGSGTATAEGRRKEILAFISRRALATFPRITYDTTISTYTDALKGLRSRVIDSNQLPDRFVRALANIRNEYSVPALKGSADIYTYEQAVLLASNNEWNPRPIIQSYSAYTPDLARLNEHHLRGGNAPNWVLVDLLAIDGRFPLLEDGLSWPALIDNYTFTSFDGQFVLMRRNQVIQTKSNFDVIGRATYRAGMTVALPKADGPLFAQIDLKPTLLGRLLMILYKPPQLNLVAHLKNGKTSNYRIISNMIATGFILSPLVRNTEELAFLAVGDRRFQEDARVEAISIEPSYGGSLLWSSTYTLTLKRYSGRFARAA